MPVNFSKRSYPKTPLAKGYTLIELVIGFTVLAVALGVVLMGMLPREKQSADLIHMIRAAELGQSLMNEITAKPFDELTMAGSLTRCNEEPAFPCTSPGNLGTDGESTRSQFNDVDDYDGLSLIGDSLGDLYKDFTVSVQVFYDNNYDGIENTSFNVDDPLAKLITITVTTPLGTPVTFSSYRANYE